MALSTTQSVWRSGGGDQTRTAYCGSMVMQAQFYVANVAATATKVQVSSTDTRNVILPPNAVVTEITIATTTSTGGSSPTVDFGYTLYGAGTSVTDALAQEMPCDSVNMTNANHTPGASLNKVVSATDSMYITCGKGASSATSGTLVGSIRYYVADDGQQNV